MLVALAEDQSYIVLTKQLQRAVLQQLREEQAFSCPQCKAPVILKVGAIKIPHFAHKKHSSCDALFTEGESSTHLLGKQQLLMLFQQLGLHAELEPYFAHLQQRPDLLVTKNDQRYAIEFQYSRLAVERFHERTDGYVAHRLLPIWLLSTPSQKFKQQGIIKISINHFQRLFVKEKALPFLMTYDVESETFYYISHLLHFQGQQYFGFGQAIPLSAQVFPFYTPASFPFELFLIVWQHYQQENSRYLHARLMFSRTGVNDELLRAIYELKLSKEQLPSFIGIPLKGQQNIAVPAVEWQLSLFFFMHIHQFSYASLTKNTILYFLQWANLDCKEGGYLLVQRYVQLLKHFKIDNPRQPIEKMALIQYVYNELFAIE